MSPIKILLCGLPYSGKTTFLAALWYIIFHEEIPTALKRGPLPQNREYLNDIAQKWVGYIEIDRTEAIKEISIPLTLGMREVALYVPDMNGETWEGLWAHRLCDARTAEWIKDADGIMLFLHADKIIPPVDLETFWDMAGKENKKKSAAAIKGTPWDPLNSPTQAKLTDILQILTLPPLGAKGRRLAVIISAWDKAESANKTPEEYIRLHMPLLYQFLLTSGGLFKEIRYYGVSALGDDLERARAKSEDVPSKRIKVVEKGKATHHDLTIPIQWLMENG